MSELKEYKNDHLTVTAQEAPGCLIKLDVQVSTQGTDAAYAKAIKVVTNQVSIPGFRKGKAPRDLVLSHYKKHIDEEWKDLVLNTSFKEALDLIQKMPSAQESVKQPQVKKISREEGAHFTIEFEVAPEVPTLEIEKLTIDTPKLKEVTEQHINAFLREMQIWKAEWEDIEDRGVQEGDFVYLTIENLEEPGEFLCEDTRFEASEGKMGKWIYDLLLGLTPGNSIEGVSEKQLSEGDAQADSDEVEFIPTKCRITLNKIKKATLPALDDHFAKEMKAESLEDLLKNVELKLKNESEQIQQKQIKRQIKSQLLENYSFEVPKSFSSAKSEEEISKIRLFLLARNFAKNHAIDVTGNEIYNVAMQEMMQNSELAELLRNGNERQIDHIRSEIYAGLLVDKVLTKIIDLQAEQN